MVRHALRRGQRQHEKEQIVIATPHVDQASARDLEALAELRTRQGWQRSDRLLRAVVAWEGGRIFLVREGELNPDAKDPLAPVASTSVVAAGTVGVIGTVITREDYRRRGLGRRVMETALDWMRERGVRSVLLDATEEGRPLYFSLGFVGIEQSYFAHAEIDKLDFSVLHVRAASDRVTIAPAAALEQIRALDVAAFGGDRMGFLKLLLATPRSWLYTACDDTEQYVGYALVRCLDAPYTGLRLGPWVARTPGAAAALLRDILAPDAPWRRTLDAAARHEAQIFASIPGTNKDSLSLWESVGGTVVEDDLIMQLDFERNGAAAGSKPGVRQVSEHPHWLYSWAAPMVF